MVPPADRPEGSLGVDHSVLDHDGPWTEEAYLELTAAALRRGDGRVELVEGTLLIGPGPSGQRSGIVANLRDAVAAALPEGLRVAGPISLRLGTDCVLVPDLVVTRTSEQGAGEGTEVLDAADALLVVEVVGREHGVADRSFKPQLYALSRIPYSVLVDHHTGAAAAHMLIGGRYHEYARSADGQALVLEEPFPLRLPLAAPPVSGGAVPAGR